jgi:hypothetical protein
MIQCPAFTVITSNVTQNFSNEFLCLLLCCGFYCPASTYVTAKHRPSGTVSPKRRMVRKHGKYERVPLRHTTLRKLLIFYISKFRQMGFKKKKKRKKKDGRKERRKPLSPKRCILEKMVNNPITNIPLCELCLERTDFFLSQ